ncbi:amino acid permease [Oceanicola sp. 22II-s10i]|uniref:APC family permease n=1 Tax=Oceanicola sp. 22II-s10i TaxID=1317116 RepID=UPI000B5218C4|nr:amino acid permease [Oceanicola sp. 22II-s10i]OWU83963.1 amino acid permease [Oceanicola sp. 22II-s10i]
MSDTLKRRIGLPLLVAYGVGVMVGAGIYVLVGAVAAQAGIWAPLAFLIAGCVALPSALSYAELASRMPEAAGEVAYVESGLGSRALAEVVGLAIVIAGMISAAAVLRGGAGYFIALVPIDMTVAIVIAGVALTAIAIAGVLESMAFAALFTLAEATGLVLVAWAGFSGAPVPDWTAPAAPYLPGIAAAVALCFFAFIGFEDLVNMAEEVRDPTRIMPRGILIALAITAVLYALVSLAAVRAVPLEELAASEQPLALVWEEGTGRSAGFLSAIAVMAAVNGVLAQIVMAARVMLGLGRRARWLQVFAEVHPRYGTPLRASVLAGAVVILAALALPVAVLAEATAYVLFAVFILVNLSLIRLKLRLPAAPFRTPLWVPVAGLALAVAALLASLWGTMS